MPPKSDAVTDIRAATLSGSGGSVGGLNSKDGYLLDDQTLPKSIVTRLAKGVLPKNTKLQKDAILALSKGGTVFINYLCAIANDQAKLQGRKTLNPKDVLEAMQILEFKNFLPRLKAELEKFDEIASEKRAATKKSVKPIDVSNIQLHGACDRIRTEYLDQEKDYPPATKKIRVGAVTDSEVNQGKISSFTGPLLLVRGWGDEDEEDQAMVDENELDEFEETEETESEGQGEEEIDESLEAVDTEVCNTDTEDEAFDNGVDSDQSAA